MKKKHITIPIIIICIAVVVTLCFWVFLINAYQKFPKTVKVSADGVTEETFTVTGLTLYPSQSKEYSIDLICDVTGDFQVDLFYSETADGGLKDYVNVTVSSGEYLFEGGLADLYASDSGVSSQSTIWASNPTTVSIVYAMPSGVGNEAQNTYSTFDVLLRIRKI